MSKALSLDLRTRVLAAIGGGLSCRQAAQRFGVSASSAIRWRALERTQGDARPKALGGDRCQRALKSPRLWASKIPQSGGLGGLSVINRYRDRLRPFLAGVRDAWERAVA